MNRRVILLIALGLLVIIFSGLGYYVIKGEPEKTSSFQFIPENSNAVLVINNYERAHKDLLLNNLMWQELLMNSDVRNVNNMFTALDSLFRTYEDADDFLSDLRLVINFQLSGGNKFSPTFIIPFPGLKEDEVADFINHLASGIEPYGLFEELEIRKLNFRDTVLSPLFFSIAGGHFIASTQPDQLESAIRCYHNGKSINSLKDFQTVSNTTGSFSDWNIYANYADKEGLKFFGLNEEKLGKQGITWSGWTALDAIVHPNLLLISGFSTGSITTFLKQFEKQKSQDIDAISIIPDDAVLFFHFGTSNYAEYLKARKEYLKARNELDSYNKAVERLQNEYQLDIETELGNWFANEFGVMYFTKNEKTDPVAFFRLSDRRRALAVLNNLSESGEMHENDGQISRLSVENFLDGIESNFFAGFDKPYFTVVDKYLILSNQKSMVEHVRDHYIKDQTLKKSESYATFASNLSDQSNIYIYANTEKALPVYRDILDERMKEFALGHIDILKKFEHIGIQFKDSKGSLYYQHAALCYSPNKKSEGNILWQLALDTTVVMKPQIVYNHYTNAREIFVQDVANKIYLIDNKGNIIWKRQMKEPIKSEIYQIDVMKNNKLQILFSGESSIYLIDRKGRDVENYPVQLPAVSTNGIAVFDYEKNREYRILIGVRGGKILNYDRFGKLIDGWNFQATEEIISPINYFVLNDKDYIVTVGSEGSPFIVNRRGEERVPLKELLPPDNVALYVLELSNEINQCKFVTTDATGNVVKLKFNGEKEILNFDVFSEKHMFLYDDLNNDRKNEYIITDAQKIVAYDHGREKLFELELENEEIGKPSLYHFENNTTMIGMSDISGGKVYLIKETGGFEKSFPLAGKGEFTISDLNKDGRYNLIVGLDNRLMVYNLP